MESNALHVSVAALHVSVAVRNREQPLMCGSQP